MYNASEADLLSDNIFIIITEPGIDPFYEAVINSTNGSAIGKNLLLIGIWLVTVILGGFIDYDSTQKMVGFNSTTRIAVIQYRIGDDAIVEDNEQFTITLMPVVGHFITGDIPQATVTITDDDRKWFLKKPIFLYFLHEKKLQ